MAGKSAVVKVAIVGDNSSLNRSLKESQSGLSKFGKAIAKAGIVAGAAAAVGLAKAVEAAAADEKAQATLAKQLENTTKATKTQVGAVEEWITVQGKVLGVTDDELRPALGRLATATGSITKAQKLTSLAMDISAGTGKSLQTVTEALAKAQNGSLGGLSRMGVKIKDASGDTKSLAAITADLRGKFDGAAKAAGDTAAGKYQRLKVQLSEMGETIGAQLLPVAGDLADWLIDNQDEIEEWGNKIADATREGGELAATIAEDLWPVLKDVGGIIRDLVGWFNDLPGPIKTTGIEVAAAAFAFGKLNAALTVFNAQALTAEGRAALLASTTTKLAGAARFAAGAGGLALLIDGFRKANDDGASFGDTIKGIAGGAVLGFLAGGPIGAVIGGAAGGGLVGLAGAFAETEDKARAARLELLKSEGLQQAKDDADSLRESLLGVINAYGEIPRAAVKASFGPDDKDIQLLRDAGVSMDTIVSAVMGQADAGRIAEKAMNAAMQATVDRASEAQRAWLNVKDGVIEYRNAQGVLVTQHVSTADQEEIRKAWVEASDALAEMGVVQDTFFDRVSRNTGVIDAHRQSVKQMRDTLGLTIAEWRKWPQDVRTRFESEGLPQTITDARRLIKQFEGLQNFRSIKALVSAPGVKATRADIKKLAELYKLTPKQVKTLVKLEGGEKAKKGADDVKKAVKDAGDVKPSFDTAKRAQNAYVAGLKAWGRDVKAGFKDPVKQGTDAARTTAKTGAESVGTALKTGTLNGVNGLGPALAASMSSAVRQGIEAARTAADAHSPSRETEKLGKDLAKGLTIGVTKGSEGIKNALSRITEDITHVLDAQLKARQKAIRKRLSGKAETTALKAREKAWRDHAKAVRRALSDEIAALRENGKRQDAVTKKLQDARQALADIKQARLDYIATIKQGAVDFASVTNLDVAFNPKAMVAEMRHRLEKIRWFNSILTDLVAKGLDPTIVDQLAQAGVEGGLARALAIQQGGQAAIDEFSELQRAINQAAGQLGTTAGDDMYNAGITAAQGLVKGLESQQAKLEAAARRLARAFARAIRQELDLASGGKNKPALAFDPGSVSGSSSGGAKAKTAATTPAAPISNTYQITVQAPVGSSPAEIGRTLVTYIDSYEKAGGRRRK